MSRLHVHLCRDYTKTPWGFRLQGGKDLQQPLTVQRVFSNSPAERELQRGDQILFINNRDTANLSHKDAQDAIIHSGGQVELLVYRPPPGSHVAPLSPPIVTPRPRAPSLQASENQLLDQPEEDMERAPAKSPQYVSSWTPSSPSHYSSQPTPAHYNRTPSYSTMNGDPYYGYRPDNRPGQTTYKSKPTYLQIQVNPPSHQKHNPHHYSHYQPQQQNQHQQYYLQQQQQQQPMRHRSSWSQPPVTPTTPPPPWASQQSAPKRVTKLSKLGGGGQAYGTDFSSLPRNFSAQYGATVHRPRPDFDPDEEREPDLPLATGPVPKVCSRRNLGGGGQSFGTHYGRSATLPRRHESGRRSSQPPSFPSSGGYNIYSPTKVSSSPYGGPQHFGTDYSPKGYGQTPAQRVQTTLENITLSPRTPEAQPGAPVYQLYTPPQQQQHQQLHQHQQPSQLSPQYRPQQVYTPTSLLLEQQRLQQQQQQPQQHQPQQEAEEGEDPIPPVWERRRMFQQIDNASRSPVRTPMSNPKPKVAKPQPFSPSTKYSSYGQDYGSRQPHQSNAVWRPSHQQPYSPGQVAPALTHAAPPPWKRPEDDVDDRTPAWRSTLKSATGVKPWERDIDFQQQQLQDPAPRSVPYNPAPASGPHSTTQAPGTPGEGPKVVHLQYNSPMGLYSQENVAETYASHAKALTPTAGGDAHRPPQSYQAGDRDWSQSAVLQFINQESKKRGGGAPAVAPKPAQQQQQTTVHLIPASQYNQHHQASHYYNDAAIGASDF